MAQINIRQWYPRWISRWRTSDARLTVSLAAQGAYWNLLDAEWERGGFLPNNQALLWQLSGARSLEEFEPIWNELKPWFVQSENGQLYNQTLLELFNDAEVWSSDQHISKSQAGRKGAEARWGKRDSTANSTANGREMAEPIAEPLAEMATVLTELTRLTRPNNTTPTEKEKADVVPDNLDELTEEIGHEHPRLEHLKGKFLPENVKWAIGEAVVRDGEELVRAGTRNLRDAVSLWPKQERGKAPNPIRFYADSEYLKDPAEWSRNAENGKQRESGLEIAKRVAARALERIPGKASSAY